MELLNSPFIKIASMFTVLDIVNDERLRFINHDSNVETMVDLLETCQSMDLERWVTIPSLIFVKKNDKAIGCIYTQDDFFGHLYNTDDAAIALMEEEDIIPYNENFDINKIIQPIPSDKIISDSISLLELIQLFKNSNDFFLVLNKNEITHIVTYYDLDCNEVKIILFALILELENLLISFLRKNRLPEDDIEKLKNDIIEDLRRKDYEITNKTKNELEHNTFRFIIYNSNFIKKFKMLELINPKDTFGFPTKEDLNIFIQKLPPVRNKVAHGDSIIGYSYLIPHKTDDRNKKIKITLGTVKNEYLFDEPEKLNKFIGNLNALIGNVRSKL